MEICDCSQDQDDESLKSRIISYISWPIGKTDKEHTFNQVENDQGNNKLEMWANAQRDGRPAEYRWRPLFNAAKFG